MGLGSGREMRSGGLSPSRDQSPGISTTVWPLMSSVERVKADSDGGGMSKDLAATSFTCGVDMGVLYYSSPFKSFVASPIPSKAFAIAI